ncbi:MAG: GNAT family N-acetyltransferase [Desulfobacteraceae bacterium]
MEWNRSNYSITDDKSKTDPDYVYRLLSSTYWSKTRPRHVIEKMIEGSVCFTLFKDSEQIGFARAVTDCATFAWLADIVIDSRYRGKGLGLWMVECIVSHHSLKDTQMALQTRDAQSLYKKFGFSSANAIMSKRTFTVS